MSDTQIKEIANNAKQDYVDLLGREKLAENFLKVILTQNAKVYSINAPWGAGKTYFLKFLENSCKNQKVPFIQYNIWETDYLENPLKSILNEFLNLIFNLECEAYITDEIKELAVATKQGVSRFIDFIKTFGFHFDWVIPSYDGTSSVQMGVSKSPSANYDEYDKMKSLKDEIINNLRQIVSSIPGDKIIIGIDELDRCRPDYAIKTLEIIKHFFDIDKLVFVLAVDKEQLKNTVKVLYGISANTDCYLKKFVDVEYLLPTPNISMFVKYLIENKYSLVNERFQVYNNKPAILIQNHRNEWYCSYVQEKNYLANIIINLAQIYSLELRDIDKIILKLSIIMSCFPENSVVCLPFLIDLIILNIYHPYIYNYIKTTIPADNYQSYEKLAKLNVTTHKIIKTINADKYIESNLYECRRDLKNYFNLIDFAQDFNA